MTDTRHDTTLEHISRITDRLALINTGGVPGVTIYEEDELRRKLGELNTHFAKAMEGRPTKTRRPVLTFSEAAGMLNDILVNMVFTATAVAVLLTALLAMIFILRGIVVILSIFPAH